MLIKYEYFICSYHSVKEYCISVQFRFRLYNFWFELDSIYQSIIESGQGLVSDYKISSQGDYLLFLCQFQIDCMSLISWSHRTQVRFPTPRVPIESVFYCSRCTPPLFYLQIRPYVSLSQRNHSLLFLTPSISFKFTHFTLRENHGVSQK